MTAQEYVTLHEIITQTTAWEDAIDVVERSRFQITALDLKQYSQILMIGCGSTYYLAMAAASIFQSLAGGPIKVYPSSELLLFPQSVYMEGKILLIAVSRSGTTTETLRVAEAFKKQGRGDVIVITTDENSPLAANADLCLPVAMGQEKSVAQTRSFASMFVAASGLSHLLASQQSYFTLRQELVSAGKKIIEGYRNCAIEYGNRHDLTQFFFLGSGSRYGLACEASLKLKEMSQTISEPFHFLEFRHGPISMVNENTLVVGLISEKVFAHEMAVLDDARSFGASILTLGERDTHIEFNSGLPETLCDVLYLPVLQMLAYYRSISFDKNPDNPRNITAVVELDAII